MKNEQDIAAKAQARVQTSSARPGAYAVTASEASRPEHQKAERKSSQEAGSKLSVAPATAFNDKSPYSKKPAFAGKFMESARLAYASTYDDGEEEEEEDAKPASKGSMGIEERINAKIRGNDSSFAQMKPASVTDIGMDAAMESLENRIAKKIHSEGNDRGASNVKAVATSNASVAPMKITKTAVTNLDDRIASKTAQLMASSSSAFNGGAMVDKKVNSKMPTIVKKGDVYLSPVKGDKLELKQGVVHEMRAIPNLKGGQITVSHGHVGGPTPEHSVDNYGDNLDVENVVHHSAADAERLAVAIPVLEEQDDIFIPSAVEYDPDAKPPLYRNRRFRLYTFLVFFLLALIAVGAGVGISLGQNGDKKAGIPYREKIGIRKHVEGVIGADRLNEPLSPYSKALQWITFDDPKQIVPDDPSFIQRFIAAYFYFATSQDGPWKSCNPPDEEAGEVHTCDYERLLGVTPTISYVAVPNSTRWLSNQSECTWIGVFCDEFNQISTIDLNGMNMTGTFPEGIEHLPFLQSIGIAYSQLKSTIPTGLSTLKHLINVEAHYNLLSGTIPQELWQSRNLQRFNVAGNNITGSIPPGMANLQDLKGFYLFENQITGTIPVELSGLRSLAYIRWQRNRFHGSIPTELGQMKRVATLWFYENNLTGTIPTELGLLPLEDFRVHKNIGLTGPIPNQIYLPKMNRFDLYNCNFTGTISDSIGDMTELGAFRVQNNNLVGTLPPSVGSLTKLKTFIISGNDLTGVIPDGICEVHENNTRTDVEADCHGSIDNSTAPEIWCPEGCCISCCDRTGEICVNMINGTEI